MAKVIGFSPKVLKQATCQKCGAINEYAPNEVRTLWSGKDYSGGSDGAKGFTCGNCGDDVITERW